MRFHGLTNSRWILFLLNICFFCWIITIYNVRVYERSQIALGPFQYLPLIFWPPFIIVIYLSLISSTNKTKYISAYLVGLMSFGTLSIIMPCGGAQPDAYAIASYSKLIFNYGTCNFGYPYIVCYPLSFIFHGALQEILGISVREFVRFYPLFIVTSQLFGIAIFVNMVSKHFKRIIDDKTFIIALSYSSFAIFMFSLGTRTDPVPQTYSLVLLPYFLASFPIRDMRWRFASLIIFVSLISTHMITSCIAILFAFSLLLFIGKDEIISRLSYLLSFWFIWVIFVGLWQLKYGVNTILKLIELESNFEDIITNMSGIIISDIPGIELYLLFRRLTLILILLLLIFSISILLLKKQRIALLFLCFLLCTSPFLVFYFSKQGVFVTRFIEISALILSLVLGFGIYELLKHLGRYMGREHLKILPTMMIVIILVTSLFSILTARHSDTVFGFSESQITGSEFLVYILNNTIHSSFPLPLEYKGYQPISSRSSVPISKIMNEIDSLSGSRDIIGISLQLKNQQNLGKFEEDLIKSKSSMKLYDNGNFRSYTQI